MAFCTTIPFTLNYILLINNISSKTTCLTFGKWKKNIVNAIQHTFCGNQKYTERSTACYFILLINAIDEYCPMDYSFTIYYYYIITTVA